MKKIEAIIRHNMLESVKDSLVKANYHGLTVTEVRGFGRQKGQTEMYRGAEYKIDFVPKILLTIVSADDDAGKIVDIIIKTAQTGKIGDGKIFVSELSDAIRIRTAERGNDAV
jgi:nitrogen regulatory protein P-II 1